jgi:hypothetical protein
MTQMQTKPETFRKHARRSHDNKDITQEEDVAENTIHNI